MIISFVVVQSPCEIGSIMFHSNLHLSADFPSLSPTTSPKKGFTPSIDEAPLISRAALENGPHIYSPFPDFTLEINHNSYWVYRIFHIFRDLKPRFFLIYLFKHVWCSMANCFTRAFRTNPMKSMSIPKMVNRGFWKLPNEIPYRKPKAMKSVQNSRKKSREWNLIETHWDPKISSSFPRAEVNPPSDPPRLAALPQRSAAAGTDLFGRPRIGFGGQSCHDSRHLEPFKDPLKVIVTMKYWLNICAIDWTCAIEGSLYGFSSLALWPYDQRYTYSWTIQDMVFHQENEIQPTCCDLTKKRKCVHQQRLGTYQTKPVFYCVHQCRGVNHRSDLVKTRAQVRNVMVFFMPTASLGLYWYPKSFLGHFQADWLDVCESRPMLQHALHARLGTSKTLKRAHKASTCQ